ncbi:MAG TPA: S8 family serine peptidase [Actinomycetota bacterium]|nr:S8 family serine peptidase [Actinomycetota bacterium]
MGIVRSFGLRRGRALLIVAALAMPALATGLGGVPRDASAGSQPLEPVQVIVQKRAAADPAPELAVRRLGGQVTAALPIVAGFAATLPAAAVDQLARLAGVRAVTPDSRVHIQAAAAGSGIRSVYPKAIKADAVWQRGVTGRGVTVAVLDTGVASVPDLAGRLVQVRNDLTGQTTPCKNLSGELDCNDRYGHGTFIAGLIAGNGASSGGTWKGVAPEASILSVKAAGADGSADVSNILAAIQWVVSFKDRYNIRVLNLSLGTDSTQDWRVDPLNYAVERAWAAGMTVVVAASNLGPAAGTVTKPADDPWVITVGATDDRGTAGLSDDRLPDFSGRGPTAHGLAKPDLAAPGAHVVSLRAPGSTIDSRFPNYVDGSYRQGSGTSMATGVVSGAAALMLQANPGFTPDRVKHALVATARDAASDDRMAVGAGVVDADAAAFSAPAGLANQGLARSSGRGSLALSRGSVQVKADNLLGTVLGPVLGATLTAQLLLWNPTGYTGAPWLPSDWYLSTWEVNRWNRVTWYGNDWPGSKWHGSSWYGQGQGESYGSPLPGSAWYGAWE